MCESSHELYDMHRHTPPQRQLQQVVSDSYMYRLDTMAEHWHISHKNARTLCLMVDDAQSS